MRISSSLNAFGEYIHKELCGTDALRIDEKFKKIIFGGIQENGSYSTNSLAEFYSHYFGVGLSSDDRKRYMNCIISQVEPKGIVIKGDLTGKNIDSNKDNDFSMFHYISTIHTLCASILNKVSDKGIVLQSNKTGEASEIKGENFMAFINDPKLILSDIVNFYNTSLKILPTYNEYGMFIYSIHSIPKDYFMQAYPSISGNFSELINTLDLETMPIVKLTESDKYVEYIFPMNSGITSDILRLFECIFNMSKFLSAQPGTLFNGVMNEYSRFLENSWNSVKGILDAFAEQLINRRQDHFYINIDEKGFTSNYDVFPNYHISGISKSISPLLFSGCFIIRNGYDKSFSIINKMIGELQ